MAIAPIPINRRARRAAASRNGSAPPSPERKGTPTRQLEVAAPLLAAVDGQSVLDAFGRRITLHVTDHPGRKSSIGVEVRPMTFVERLTWALRPRPFTADRWRE